MYVQVSDSEMLLDDSLRLARRAHTYDVEVHVDIWRKVPHVWQAFGFLPESNEALEKAGTYISQSRSLAVTPEYPGTGQTRNQLTCTKSTAKTPISSSWRRLESPTHISLIYLYDQSALGEQLVRFTHIREHINNRLNSAPVFQQKIMRTPADIDYPYWVDDEKFDLDFHVRHLALPKPGDWRQFCILTSRLHSRPLDMSRPLWELYVIEGLHNVEGMPRNSFAIYFKVHHCAMDEFTAQELLQSAARPDPQHPPARVLRPAHRPPAHGAPAASGNGLAGRGQQLGAIGAPGAAVGQQLPHPVQDTHPPVDSHGAEHGAKDEDRRNTQPLCPATELGARVRRRLLPRGRFSTITCARVPGATLTHAILAICGEAMRRYLERHGEFSDASLQALLEVNVRNAGAHALVGNRIAINQVELHTPDHLPGGPPAGHLHRQPGTTVHRELPS